jgi:hypothetical protein
MSDYSHTHLGLLLSRAKEAGEHTFRGDVMSLEDSIRAEAAGLGRLHVLEVKQAINRLASLAVGYEYLGEIPDGSGGWNHAAMD